MNEQAFINYERIAKAIDFINNNFKNQPSLDEVAAHVNMSAFHFQKLFTEWAGVSPKKFLQYSTLAHAKKLLKHKKINIAETAFETGLSGTSRLHDLFINIEGMTPAEFKNEAKGLVINYQFTSCPFGNILIASTQKGICFLSFFEDKNNAVQLLKSHFVHAELIEGATTLQNQALQIFNSDNANLNHIKLHLKGTSFQLKVWEALLKIPMGALTSYSSIAEKVGNPNASRAVGTAIGSNPVAFLIPCHRVIQASGAMGGYLWGLTRKSAMIGWESALTIKENQTELF